jgi:predicted GTPase
MPYGDLERQRVQRFASYDDLGQQHVTIEEREEFEPWIKLGMVVYAGVDYQQILGQAEAEADLILWDGGNNDFPFYRPDLHLVLVDPHRPGHELAYHPGETNLRLADALVINKVDSASPENLAVVQASCAAANPSAPVILSDSVVTVAQPELVRGKRAVVVGDGPTLTHGGMPFGAGTIAAQRLGAAAIVAGSKYAVGSIKAAYQAYPHMKTEVPALGYSPQQAADLAATLNAAEADVVLYATPVDLARLVKVNKPMAAVEYELRERGAMLEELLGRLDQRFFKAA